MSHAQDPRSPVSERRMLGIVLDRCESRHPWQDHFWRASALLPEGGSVGEWRLLGEGPGWHRDAPQAQGVSREADTPPAEAADRSSTSDPQTSSDAAGDPSLLEHSQET